MTTTKLSTGAISGKAGALVRAAAILGGVEPLSAYLRISQDDLRKWMAGNGEPPYSAFILAIDVIVDPMRTPKDPARMR